MSRLHLRRPSSGLVVATVALFVALGGGAVAAASDKTTDKKIANKAAKSYFNGHIGSASVSHAGTAGSATSANSATNANHATSADSASNAASVGGQTLANYSGNTAAGGTKTVNIGAFTITNTNTGTGCGPNRVTATNNGNTSNYFLVDGVPGGITAGLTASGAGFGASVSSSTVTQVAGPNAANTVIAALANGQSSMWGMIGSVTNGTSCVTTGGLFGN